MYTDQHGYTRQLRNSAFIFTITLLSMNVVDLPRVPLEILEPFSEELRACIERLIEYKPEQHDLSVTQV